MVKLWAKDLKFDIDNKLGTIINMTPSCTTRTYALLCY